jgi:hypothetical protein
MKHLGTLMIAGSEVGVFEGNRSDNANLDGVYAVYLPDDQEIWLFEGLPPHEKLKNLVHEVLHAVIGCSGAFDITASALGLAREDTRLVAWEESFVRVMTPHIFEIFGPALKTRKKGKRR